MNPSSSTNPSSLQFVSKLRTRERIAALGQALLSASPKDRDAMAMMLIELASYQGRASQDVRFVDHPGGQASGPIELITKLPEKWRARHADDALTALARSWSNLSAPIKALAVTLGRDRWIGVVRELSKDREPGSRLAALRIASDTADPGLGQVVATLLADEQQSVRRAADETMLRLIMLLLEHQPNSLLGDEFAKIARMPRIEFPADSAVMDLERCTLLGAVADAAWAFASHRCRSPLIGALLLMDRDVASPMEREICTRMRRLLGERSHPSHAPLRTVLKRTPCPLLRERAFRWLPIAPISIAAGERLCNADSLNEHEIVLRKAYLGLRPARAHQIVSTGRARLASGQRRLKLPLVSQWASLSSEARIGLVSLLALIPLDESERRALLEPALADEDPRVRLQSAMGCSMLDLSDYLYDTHSSVARHAALRWSTVGYEPSSTGSPGWSHRQKLASTTLRSPHRWVRRIADEERARLSSNDPRCPRARLQARRMYRTDPVGFVRQFRDRLADPAQAVEAVQMIGQLGVEGRFELDLIGIVQQQDQNPRLRATAVTVLSRVHSDSARFILQEAMQDADPRARANAIETVPVPASRLLEFKDDPNHRVRASAIRRMISQSDHPSDEHGRMGSEELLRLLDDERTEHRLAGAWAAQRVVTGSRRAILGSAWSGLINRIESLRADDPDPRIRERAGCCIRRLTQDLRIGTARVEQRALDSLRAELSDESRARSQDGEDPSWMR